MTNGRRSLQAIDHTADPILSNRIAAGGARFRASKSVQSSRLVLWRKACAAETVTTSACRVTSESFFTLLMDSAITVEPRQMTTP